MKTFFSDLFGFFKDKWSVITDSLKNLFDFSGIKLPKIGDLFGKSNSSQLSSKIAEVQKAAKPSINRTQSNNFTINIHANKNDSSEAIANKVMNRVQDYSRTFLYDEVVEAI